MDRGSENSNSSDDYRLSDEDFQQPPLQYTHYEPGGAITRENFASYLIKSFRISRGAQKAQNIFFRWTKINGGFQFDESLQSYLKKGGFDNLSKKEQDEIKRAIEDVDRHSSLILTHLGENFDANLLIHANASYQQKTARMIPDDELAHLPYSELLLRLSLVIEEERAERRKIYS